MSLSGLSHRKSNISLGPSLISLGPGLVPGPTQGQGQGQGLVSGQGQTQDSGQIASLSRYRLLDPSLGLDVTYSSCWQHREDVKGKPGLIADTFYAQSNPQSNLRAPQSNINSTQSNLRALHTNHLIFLVSYGAIPRLMVTFLQTYTNDTGCVEIYFLPLQAPFRASASTNTSPGASISLGTRLNSVPSPGPGPSLSPGASPVSGYSITNESQLISLPWEKLAYIDPKLTPLDQFDKVSLSWTHVYVPNNHESNDNNTTTTTTTNNNNSNYNSNTTTAVAAPAIKLYGEFVSSHAMRPHSSYILKVTYTYTLQLTLIP